MPSFLHLCPPILIQSDSCCGSASTSRKLMSNPPISTSGSAFAGFVESRLWESVAFLVLCFRPCPCSCPVLAVLVSLCLCPCRACLCFACPCLCQTHRCQSGHLLLGVTDLEVSCFEHVRGLHTRIMFLIFSQDTIRIQSRTHSTHSRVRTTP